MFYIYIKSYLLLEVNVGLNGVSTAMNNPCPRVSQIILNYNFNDYKCNRKSIDLYKELPPISPCMQSKKNEELPVKNKNTFNNLKKKVCGFFGAINFF